MTAPLPSLARSLRALKRAQGQTLWVEFERAGKTAARVSSESGWVRWGPRPGLHFVHAVPGVDKAETLFWPGLFGPNLVVRQGMTGEILAGGSRLLIEDLTALGLTRGFGKHRLLRLTPQMAGRVEYRDLVVTFEFGAPAAVEAKIRLAPTPKEFRRKLLQRDDMPFARIAWCVYGVLTLAVAVIATRPYPKETATLAELGDRVAKLVYEAPQSKSRVQQEILRKVEEQRAAARARAEAQQPRQEEGFLESMAGKKQAPETTEAAPKVASRDRRQAARGAGPAEGGGSGDGTGGGGGDGGGGGGGGGYGGEGSGGGGPAGLEGPGTAAPGWAGPSMRAEEVRRSVSGKGLLGLLGGRGGASRARTGGAIFSGSGRGGGGGSMDLDRVLDKIDGVQMGRGVAGGTGGSGGAGGWVGGGAGGGGGSGSGGGYGRPVARGIDDAARQVAAAAGRPQQLQERKDQEIKSKEADLAPDPLSLREATATINKVVGTYLGGIRYLYNKELRKNPDLEGKLTVSMTIAPSGAVSDCRVVDSTLGAPELERAVLERIRKWTFPSVSERPITVTYPFVFFPSM